jgi:hypothetical protein
MINHAGLPQALRHGILSRSGSYSHFDQQCRRNKGLSSSDALTISCLFFHEVCQGIPYPLHSNTPLHCLACLLPLLYHVRVNVLLPTQLFSYMLHSSVTNNAVIGKLQDRQMVLDLV